MNKMEKHMSSNNSKLAIAKAEELVRLVMREDPEVRQQSLSDQITDMMEEFVFPDIPSTITDKKEVQQYVEHVFNLFKVKLINRIQKLELDRSYLFDEDEEE
jgi:hypothetical protein